MRNLLYPSSIICNCSLSLEFIHSIALADDSGCFNCSSMFHDFIRRNAFHILFEKFLPCSQYDSSNNKSLPAGEQSNIPTRTPSAPNLLINSSGSGQLPKDLLILRPNLSRTIPVRYTLSNGFLFLYSHPAIIIRATQKNRISGAVTRSFGG